MKTKNVEKQLNKAFKEQLSILPTIEVTDEGGIDASCMLSTEIAGVRKSFYFSITVNEQATFVYLGLGKIEWSEEVACTLNAYNGSMGFLKAYYNKDEDWLILAHNEDCVRDENQLGELLRRVLIDFDSYRELLAPIWVLLQDEEE